MPHKIAQEVTGEELLNKYTIQSSQPKVKGWVKDIVLDGLTRYEVRLYWNDDDGYSTIWATDAPPEADRPEFEYILDSLTEAGF